MGELVKSFIDTVLRLAVIAAAFLVYTFSIYGAMY